jgi:hypothetical protein
MADETTGVRITQQAIYAKQLEHGDALVKILEKLEHLDDVPNRLRDVELNLAKLAWIEKIAYTGLAAGIGGFISALFAFLVK